MNESRIDVRIPAQRRQELDRLSEDTGLSVCDLIRLATQRLINDPGRLAARLVGGGMNALADRRMKRTNRPRAGAAWVALFMRGLIPALALLLRAV